MIRKRYIIISILLLIFLTACSRQTQEQTIEEERAVLVGVEELSNFKSLNNVLNYPATVKAEAEANIFAKVSGTVINQNVKLGEFVQIGDVLANLDSASNISLNSSQINSNQLRQAQIALSQAQKGYDSALSNYNQLIQAVAKDIRQAELAVKQAQMAVTNLDLNFNENIKSAQIAYQSAQEASIQAKNNLENREKQLNKSLSDLNENIEISINSSLDMISALLVNINNITGFSDNNVVNIAYKNNLGALDSSSLINARNLYNQTLSRLNQVNLGLDELIDLAYLNKDLSDAVKVLFNKTITSSNLSQIELSSLQSQANSFQSQSSSLLNNLISQKQAKENLKLELTSTLDALRSAYQLALKQEASTLQNLNSLSTSSSSQGNQAELSVSLAENQLENLKIKSDTQIDNAMSQLDLSRLQYENARIALESLYDSYTLISSLDGQLSFVAFDVGDTVSAGSLMFRVSKLDNLKLVFFVDLDIVSSLYLGQEIEVENNYIAYISRISPQADQQSKKFEIEASFKEKVDLPVNKIISLKIKQEKLAIDKSHYYLPLSTLFINQNENFIYAIDADSRIEKIEVEILEIIGELAKIEILQDNVELIIVENNRRLREGQLVEIR